MNPLAVVGLNGDFRGTCIGCLTPTDSAVAIGGDAEVHVAFLSLLGVGQTEAIRLVNLRFHVPDVMRRHGASEDAATTAVVSALDNGTLTGVPGGDIEGAYRLCAECAEKVGLTPILAVTGAEFPINRIGGDSEGGER